MAWPSARKVPTSSTTRRKAALERLKIGDLAADMNVDADDLDALQAGRLRVGLARAAPGNAELGFRRAGGDLGVGPGIDIGIDADGDRRASRPCAAATSLKRLKLGLAFDIELIDAGLERQLAFRPWSCRRRKRRSARPGMPAASAFFSSPPDTTSAPAPSLRQCLQHGEIAVRLDRKGDQRALRAALPRRRGSAAPASRWNSNRTACRPRRASTVEIDVLGVQHAVLVRKVIHRPIGRRAAWTDPSRPSAWSVPSGSCEIALHAAAGNAERKGKQREGRAASFQLLLPEANLFAHARRAPCRHSSCAN